MEMDVDLNGASIDDIKRNLNQVMRDATNNGTLTGNTPATIEGFSFIVKYKGETLP